MNVVLPKPIRESEDTVTLSRSDWNTLIELLEDAEDAAAVIARKSRENSVGVQVERRNYLTGDELRRLLNWDASPVRIWREKRSLTQRELASKAGVSHSYLAEIETGQKPGSADALLALARELDVPMEMLVGTNRLQMAYGHLKQFIDAGATRADIINEVGNVVSVLKEHGVVGIYLSDLKDRLRTLAVHYHNTGRTSDDDALLEAVQHSLP
jgi:transcriptional regulator with XRE-family HTH domain